MSEQSPYLVAPYTALAQVYDAAGFADYTRSTALTYINEAQARDWAGRRIIDLGCGTGISSWLLASRGFRVTGVDSSEAMLHEARTRDPAADADLPEAQESPDFVHSDMRALDYPAGTVDMVLALDGVFNALSSPRVLQQMFSQVASWLDPERFFIFDMWTITGLATLWGSRDQVIFDNDDLLILARNSFSYETLTTSTQYTIMQREEGGWQRADEQHKTHGYPVHGIISVLERCGFDVLMVVSPDMQPFDADNAPYGRAVFMVRRLAT